MPQSRLNSISALTRRLSDDALKLFLLVFPRPTLQDQAVNRSATTIADFAAVSLIYWSVTIAAKLPDLSTFGMVLYSIYLTTLYAVRFSALKGWLKTALAIYAITVAFFYVMQTRSMGHFETIQASGSLITVAFATLTLGYRVGGVVMLVWMAIFTTFRVLTDMGQLTPLDALIPDHVSGYENDWRLLIVNLGETYIFCSLVRAHIFSQLNRTIREKEGIATLEHAARKAADKANSEKTRFMAAASHDLRQPVSSLNLNFETYVLSHPEIKDDTVVQEMAGSLETLNKLLDSVLTVSKLQAKVMTPVVSSVSIASILQRSYASNSAQARQKNLQLRLRTADIYCDTDPDMLYRAVNNLVDNAVKYTERGGIIIGVRRRHGAPCIFVMDSGIGIAPESRDSIFEEFTMLIDPSRKSAGSGLGLAIVKRTADLLGMKIHTESKVGVGSTFYLQLPKLRAKPVKQDAGAGGLPPVARRQLGKLDGLLVAVVDDVVTLRISICRMLQAHGMRTIDAGSWAELETQLNDATPDVLITDYQLDQDKSGYDVVLAARKHISENLPCFIITGDTSPDLVRELANLNVETLYKPLGTDAVLAAIERHVGARVA